MPTVMLHSIEERLRSKLKELGYFNIEVSSENRDNYTFEIKAEGKMRSIFIEVRIRLMNDRAQPLSKSEILTIKNKALNSAKEPWVATVIVNENGELADSIQWKDLSTVG